MLNPEVPPFLDELILTMLEKAPAQRPSAEQVVAALEGFNRESIRRRDSHARPKLRHRIWWAATRNAST